MDAQRGLWRALRPARTEFRPRLANCRKPTARRRPAKSPRHVTQAVDGRLISRRKSPAAQTPRAELDFRRCCRRFADVSNDVKLTVGVCVIVVAIFGSAGLVSHVMIELAGVVRADLQALRESMEAIACGELARNDDAVAGIETSNRPRQWPTADRPTAIAHPPVDASPNGHRYDGTIAVSIPRGPERCWRYRAENHPGQRAALCIPRPRAASADARSRCAPRPPG